MTHIKVPNFWQPQQISYDRTEPMIGSKVRSLCSTATIQYSNLSTHVPLGTALV